MSKKKECCTVVVQNVLSNVGQFITIHIVRRLYGNQHYPETIGPYLKHRYNPSTRTVNPSKYGKGRS